MSSYFNKTNYENFLSSALTQASQVENTEEISSDAFAQAQEAFITDKDNQKNMGFIRNTHDDSTRRSS